MDAAAEDLARRCTVPLLTTDPKGRPRVLGSGVLCNAGSLRLLLTARHALEADDVPVYLPGCEGLPGLQGHVLLSQVVSATQTQSLDIAVVSINSNTYGRLHPEYASANLCTDFVLVEPQLDKGCFVCGYPATKMQRNFATRSVTCTPLVVRTRIVHIADNSRGTTSFQVRFARDHKHAEPRFAPEPYGMSGCGVWFPLSIRSLRAALLGLALCFDAKNRTMEALSVSGVFRSAIRQLQ